MDEEWISLTEEARRLGLDLGGFSRKIRRWEIPTRAMGCVKLIEWSSMQATFATGPPAQAGFRSLVELASETGKSVRQFAARCRKRGIKTHHRPPLMYAAYVRIEDVPRLLATRGEATRVDPATGCKRCSKCRVLKPIEAFYRSRRSSSRLASQCKACHGAMTRKNGRDRCARNQVGI